MDFDTVEKLRELCIAHAKELLRGSRLLLKDDLPNLAYHLAVLALEEVGKAAMILIGHTTTNNMRGERLLIKAGEEHTKKLFWALWLPSFGKGEMTAEEFRSYIDLANNIHITRMKGLYVDPTSEAMEPSKAIQKGQVDNIINLVEARIRIEENHGVKEPTQEEKNLLIWFEQANQDSDKKKLMLGRKSLNKLKELEGDALKWISWMKEQFDIADKEALDLTRREMERKEPADDEKVKPKWSVKFTLFSPSHSVRQSILTKFNKRIPDGKIKLFEGKKTSKVSTLIIEKILPKGVPVQSLWYAGWGDARCLAISLNIASQGFFWWDLPKDIDKFYDKITDLESNTEIRVERNPALRLNWGNNVLTEQMLVHTIMCYGLLPRGNVDFLNAYTTGISFLGKNDIHTPFEKEIFLDFYHALIGAIKYYDDFEASKNNVEVIDKIFNELIPDSQDFPKEHAVWAEELLTKGKASKEITLSECGSMKILCDFYILKKLLKISENERKMSQDSDRDAI